MKMMKRTNQSENTIDRRALISLPRRTRIERTEMGVYVGTGWRRGFMAKQANQLAPFMSRRIDARQLAALEARDNIRFEPSTLASIRGNLRTDETLLCIGDLTFPTKEGGRVIGDVSMSFRLTNDVQAVAALLNAGIPQQISVELPRRLRGVLSAEIGRWAQRDVIENLLPIRDNTREALAQEIGIAPERGKLNLGLELINVTVLLRTPDLHRNSSDRGPDLIADLARAREAWGDISSHADERRIAQMFDGIIRQHLLRTLSSSKAKVFVVPTEATGMLGNFQDMERMAEEDPDGAEDGAPPMLPSPEGEAA